MRVGSSGRLRSATRVCGEKEEAVAELGRAEKEAAVEGEAPAVVDGIAFLLRLRVFFVNGTVLLYFVFPALDVREQQISGAHGPLFAFFLFAKYVSPGAVGQTAGDKVVYPRRFANRRR